MVSVKVVRTSTGKVVEGVRVGLGFDGIFRGMAKDQYTNSDGEAHFDNDPGDGDVYVDGMSKFNGRIQGKVVVYI